MTKTPLISFFQEKYDTKLEYYVDEYGQYTYIYPDGSFHFSRKIMLETILQDTSDCINNGQMITFNFNDIQYALPFGFYTIDDIYAKIGDKRKNYEFFNQDFSQTQPKVPMLLSYMEFMMTYKDELSDLLVLEQLYMYMTKLNYNTLHIIYD
jgi:hypothetical protein